MGRAKKHDEKLLLQIIKDYEEEFDCEIRIADLVRYAAARYGTDISRKSFERCQAAAQKIRDVNDMYRKRLGDREAWKEEQYKTIDPHEFLRKNNTPAKLVEAVTYLDQKDRNKTRMIDDLASENARLRKNTLSEEMKQKLQEAEKAIAENIILRKWIECNINGVSAAELLKYRNFPVKRALDENVPESSETVIGYENRRKPYNLSDDKMIDSSLDILNVPGPDTKDEFLFDLKSISEKLIKDLEDETNE